MKNPISQLFGQTALYGLGIVLPRLLNYLLLTPFYTRVFEREAYGVITELYAYVVFLLVILTYGMETGYFRFAGGKENRKVGREKEKPADPERVYTSVLFSLGITSVSFITAILIGSVPVSKAMGYGSHPEYVRWLAIIVAADAFTSIPFARIRLQNRAVRYAVIRISEVLVNIGLNLFFLYYCPRNPGAQIVEWVYREEIGVGYVLISNLVASISKLIWLIPEVIAAFRARINPALLKRILRYSYPLLIAGLAGTVNEAIDRVMLKHLLPGDEMPMAQLGVYGANYKLAVLMTLFVQMFKYAAEPFFFSRSEERNAKELYADIMTFFVVAGVAIFLLVTLFLDYFILFIGRDFREGSHIVPVILLANLVMGMYFNLSIWYKLTNRTMAGAFLVLTGAGITVAINVCFIPVYGYVASAWAHLISYTVMVLLSYLWSRKIYAVPYRLGRLIGYIGIALLLYLINNLFLHELGFDSVVFPVVWMTGYAGLVLYKERRTFSKYANV